MGTLAHANRMINKFFVQTNETIIDFLSEIGRNKEVFSCSSGMEIDGYMVYFYATDKEIVLLCLDYSEGETFKWQNCPVMDLYRHACLMRRFYATSGQYGLIPPIHLMLLTSSRIENYPKVAKSWHQNLFGYSVLHKLSVLKNLDYYSIPVNRDLNLPSSVYWTKWQKYLEDRGWFDWANPCFDDNPQPIKRLRW